MRNYKFRGKHVSTVNNNDSYWIYGTEINQYNLKDNNHIVTINSTIVLEDTIGEFTGLYDMHGNEVYEGDILRIPAPSEYEKNNFIAYEVYWQGTDNAISHIGWQMNKFHIYGDVYNIKNENISFLPKIVKKMEIIGNIYEIIKNNEIML